MTRRRDEHGSLGLELAMIAPGLLFILALIYVYGRVGQTNGVLESGTRDGARSATVARSYDEAVRLATKAVEEGVEDAPADCRNTLRVSVSRPYEPGNPITVTAECTYGLSDIAFPGAPGSMHPTSSFTSMLDPYRGVG